MRKKVVNLVENDVALGSCNVCFRCVSEKMLRENTAYPGPVVFGGCEGLVHGGRRRSGEAVPARGRTAGVVVDDHVRTLGHARSMLLCFIKIATAIDIFTFSFYFSASQEAASASCLNLAGPTAPGSWRPGGREKKKAAEGRLEIGCGLKIGWRHKNKNSAAAQGFRGSKMH
uniref:Uncharacterized protein n=1 Tax=Candidozyma auris TaxID=498019 RepID=A0A0L0NSD1_CANAR